jgi:YD repeat-containing protein
MKSLLYGLALSLLVSCTYKDIDRPMCYVQSEFLNGAYHSYRYDGQNQLIGDFYPGDNAMMVYNANGNIVSEFDTPDIQVIYTYNTKNQLTQMDGSSATYISYTWQIRYSYNSNGQLVRLETWLYSTTTNSLYLNRYETLAYSTNNRNYSVRKLYDGLDNLLRTQEYQWDTHPNPHLNNPYFANEPPPTNNYTSITVTPAGGSPYVYTYTYVYNNKGFPAKQLYNGNILNSYTYTNCN